ncbi:cobalt ECF transporter T component CbiQ [Metabacillus crassostreae]|uniref:cobalt ECF transporter T component CbiQ n=1 Tax=Metabacillus crassostreae TaxID=929098 RepID=UPI0019567CFB
MSNSILRIDQYANTNALKNVHPAEKCLLTISFLCFSILTENLLITIFSFCTMSLLIIFTAKIPFWQYIKLLLIPAIFLLTSIFTLLISIAPSTDLPNTFIWSMNISSWVVYISPYSLSQAYQLITTVLSSVSCLYFLIITTPLHQLIWVLRKLRLPVLFIELIGLTYQFIFVLLANLQEIYIAQSSRLGYHTYRSSLSSISMLVVTLLIKSLRYARETQIAIDSRGGDEGLYDVDHNLVYRKKHILFIVFCLTSLTSLAFFTR